jgi:hypothetical protein
MKDTMADAFSASPLSMRSSSDDHATEHDDGWRSGTYGLEQVESQSGTRRPPAIAIGPGTIPFDSNLPQLADCKCDRTSSAPARDGSLATALPMGALREPSRDIESRAGFRTRAVVAVFATGE